MANLDSSRIKSIQVKITKLEEEIKSYTLQLGDIEMNITTKQQQIKKYQEELLKLQTTSKDIIISEHAITRYIERVLKIDMEKLYQEIISDEFKTSVAKFGNGTYPHNNHFIKVVDNVIVTVIAKDEIPISKPPKLFHKPKAPKKLKTPASKKNNYLKEQLEEYYQDEIIGENNV